jgi:hypothetical protein
MDGVKDLDLIAALLSAITQRMLREFFPFVHRRPRNMRGRVRLRVALGCRARGGQVRIERLRRNADAAGEFLNGEAGAAERGAGRLRGTLRDALKYGAVIVVPASRGPDGEGRN